MHFLIHPHNANMFQAKVYCFLHKLCILYMYNRTHSLLKYASFDSVREHGALITCTLESFIFVYCLYYFSPQFISNKNVLVLI